MKIVLSIPSYADWVIPFHRNLAAAAPPGMEVVVLPSGQDGQFLTFPDLDRLWRNRDQGLLSCYKTILGACAEADVFFSISAGVHPGFLDYLPTFNCYYFCDDPEDSPWQSSKVAPAFDAAFYGNIASGFQYESWGCQRHAWLPILIAPSDIPSDSDREIVIGGHRQNGVVFVGGLDDYSSYRRQRLERFSNAFSDGVFRGRGWPNGGLSDGELKHVYLESRVGFNIHRTTGPINRRMFQLPAHGVMQICDNKTGLGKIFELGKEVVGYDKIDEAIELTKYYLDHDLERATIAEAGYQRFWKDYHAGAVWARLRDQLLEWGVKPGERRSGVKQKLPSRNASYFFGVAREKIQTEAFRMIRSTKAAKREYLRKDPWWKIYDQVFTSEAVYLPDYGDAPSLESEPASKAIKPEVMRARQGAVRWAMTQLIGKSKRIGIRDSLPHLLEAYVAVDSKRQVDVLIEEENLEGKSFDLVMSIPICDGANGLLDELKWCAKVAPVAVFAFTDETSLLRKSGEVYWLLKSLYEEVSVFKMPNPVVPWLEPSEQGDGVPLVALGRKSLKYITSVRL